MGDDAPDPIDQELADALAACDDALARGDRRTSLDALLLAGDAENRLRKKLDCVRLLRQALPRAGAAVNALNRTMHETL